MKTKLLTVTAILLICFQINSLSQEDYKEKRKKDFEKYKNDWEKEFDEFKKKREEELKKMERAYQDYYNQLHGLKDFYTENNDTASANIIDELIDFENTINENTSKKMEVTEAVVIKDEEKQESPPVYDPVSDSVSEKPKRQIEVTEAVVIKDEEKQESPPVYDPVSDSVSEKPKRQIEVTEAVVIKDEEKQESPPVYDPVSDSVSEKPKRQIEDDTAGTRVPEPPETSLVPLPEEGNTVPVLTPLPKSKARITSPFGIRNHPTLKRQKMHNGIDFGSGMNTPVYVAADGEVTLAQHSRSYGNWVMVKHAEGYISVYAHLNSFNIKVRSSLKKGDILGYTGNTGRISGPHLHYEIRLNGTPVNPSGYLTEIIE